MNRSNPKPAGSRIRGLPVIGVVALLATCGLPSLALARPAAAPAASPAPPAELTQVIAALGQIATMRADFVQTDGNGQRVTGVFTLKRPGRIRFQYAPGVPMLIIADGHALIMIDSAVNQLQRWPIGNNPLGALLDPGRYLTRYGTLQPMLDPSVIGVEVRDRSHPEYGTLTLVFTRKASAPGGFELSGWVTNDSQNSRTVIRLSNHRYGMAVPEELFRYLDTRARPHK